MEKLNSKYAESLYSYSTNMVNRLNRLGETVFVDDADDLILCILCDRHHQTLLEKSSDQEEKVGTRRIVDYISDEYSPQGFSTETLEQTKKDVVKLRRLLSAEAAVKGLDEEKDESLIACWKLELNLAVNIQYRLENGRRN